MKKIKIYPAKILREKAKKIKNYQDAEIQNLISEMILIMDSASGVGLAATQIGKSIRLCIVKDEHKNLVLINPKITSQSIKKVIMEEGCLSFPGKFFLIKRPEKVKLRYIDENGENKKIKADGLLSRAIQHEVDHLDGILIIDRIKK